MPFHGVSTYTVFALALILPVVINASRHSAIAIDEVSDQAAIEILEKAWDKKQQSKSLSDGIMTDLVRAGKADVDVTYAYLLAKVRQSDVRKAVSAAEHLLETDPNHLRGHQAYCWLLLLTRKQSSALVALQNFDKANDSNKTIDDETRLANLNSIARMYGYLEGPQAEDVSEENMRTVLKVILEGASEAEKNSFDEQRQGVLQKFRELLTDKEETEAETVAEGKKEQEETLAELKKTEEELEEREEKLGPQRDKVSAEGQAAISRIESRAVPLQSELEELYGRSRSLESDRMSFINDAIYYEGLAAREPPDSLNRDTYLLRADRARSSARSVEFTLNSVYQRMRGVASSLDIVHRELVATQRKYGAQISQIDNEMEKIDKEQKRTRGREIRASKPVRGNSGRSKALENKAKGITTYEDFPVELERERMLAVLKARTGE